MTFLSTRASDVRAGLSQAIVEGLAPGGGLYVPERVPALAPDAFPDPAALDRVAPPLLRPFAEGDPLAADLDAVCHDAFTFPAPLVRLAGTPGPASVLELFHGPTSAFKDFGARFLAASLERIRRGDERRLTILVATSGDTGSAVAAAFHGRPWVDVVLLYPKGLVSPRQAHQLACWGGNVRTFAVAGTFDDCQRLVKAAFRDTALTARHRLSSANSINVGRLLPQMAYYAAASLQVWRAEGRKPNFIVPTGNLGNGAACVWAREIGLPIGDIVLATNANRAVPDYLASGEWRPRPSVATLASAMDVGDPSNMERLRWLFPDAADLGRRVSARAVSDDEIRTRSGPTRRRSATCGARTPPRRRTSTATCRPAARASIGCSSPRRTPPSSTRSWSRSSAARCPCCRRSSACCSGRARKKTCPPRSTRCARACSLGERIACPTEQSLSNPRENHAFNGPPGITTKRTRNTKVRHAAGVSTARNHDGAKTGPATFVVFASFVVQPSRPERSVTGRRALHADAVSCRRGDTVASRPAGRRTRYSSHRVTARARSATMNASFFEWRFCAGRWPRSCRSGRARRADRGESMAAEAACPHIEAVATVKRAVRRECEECVKTGSRWVHLRTCQTCGATLCCDSSPNRHASRHAAATGHPVIASAEPGERWLYCYPDDAFAEY